MEIICAKAAQIRHGFASLVKMHSADWFAIGNTFPPWLCPRVAARVFNRLIGHNIGDFRGSRCFRKVYNCACIMGIKPIDF